eukprot:TRINITY_DN2333_c0_g3_i1.p1 TRINITY_DN2333_c0_g3~~TRINITY_DN2333_c0_g3_i1.p1  ORF type:complete len:437 (-),score=46.72 TRINITY_DN2333_c0_g3_i1:11-1321(-)
MSDTIRDELADPVYADIRSHLNFAANAFIVVMAYIMRRTGYLKEEHVAGLQFLTFKISLPVMLISVLWVSEFERSLLTVGLVSLAVHALIPLVIWNAYRVRPCDRRGLMLMASQGEGLVYAYQALSASFGPAGLTSACMWDIFGNLWLAIIGNGLAANMFQPPANDYLEQEKMLQSSGMQSPNGKETLRQRQTNDKRIAPEPDAVVPVPDSSDPARLQQKASERNGSARAVAATTLGARVAGDDDDDDRCSLGSSTCDRTEVETMATVLGDSAVSAVRGFRTGQLKQMLVPILKMPMLWGVLIGMSLNLCRVPFHYLPVKVMHLLSQCFPPLLYILLGSVLRFRMGVKEYAIVLWAVAARWMLLGSIGMAIWFSPLDEFVRSVAILCLATPCTTTLLMYGAEFGYNASCCAMTYNLSALTSVVMVYILQTFLVSAQ